MASLVAPAKRCNMLLRFANTLRKRHRFFRCLLARLCSSRMCGVRKRFSAVATLARQRRRRFRAVFVASYGAACAPADETHPLVRPDIVVDNLAQLVEMILN